MKILCLHGYNGSAHNSAFQALTECGYEVFAPQIEYDKELPKDVLCRLSAIYKEKDCNAVVGTSLGGFFAAQISVAESCPAVFINPCLLPFIYLPRLGYNSAEGVREFSEMFSDITKLDRRLISAIVGSEDEIIDTPEYTRTMLENSRYFFIIPGGKHSGFTLPLKEIFVNYGESFFNICPEVRSCVKNTR